LTKTFRRRAGLFSRQRHSVRALDDVSFEIPRGAVFGVVGESGSGKSTLGRCLLRLTEPDAGTVTWHDGTADTDVTALESEALRLFRRRMQIVFQDPCRSLNPARPVWQIVGEGLIAGATPRACPSAEEPLPGLPQHPARPSADRVRARAAAMLEAVGLAAEHLDRLPHEFSGGQRQRIAIARALLVEPEFLVCDEITSALDAHSRAQLLALLHDLRARFGLTLLFISHDLRMVERLCDEAVVMRHGAIVERGPAAALFRAPAHACTRELAAAVPDPDPRRRTFRPRPAA
jgi:peptide/nickel transport system ATP-binding protein